LVQQKNRKKVLDALLALAAERPWRDVTLEGIAERAGVALPALRASYDGRLSVLADFVRAVDEEVLERIDPALAQEAVRERLFDILFSRLEALAPHKQAIRNLARSALGDPLLALELNRLTTISMSWMMSAAGIPSTGARGLAGAQALAMLWARVLRVWVDDDDAGHARTMAELDKRLREAERAAMRLNSFGDFLGRLRPPRGRRSAPEPAEEGDVAEGHPS
jgi:AcrR family transcriptional regulator